MRVDRVARSIYSLAYAPDGAGLWIGDGTARVHLWDPIAGTGTVVFKVAPGPHTGAVYNLAVSVDAQLVAAASYDRASLVHLGPTIREEKPPADFPRAIRMALASSGAILAVSDPAGDVSVWDRKNHEVFYLDHRARFATSIAFSPDSSLLAVGYIEGNIHLFDLSTGKQDGAPLETPTPEMMTFSPDGRTLAAAVGNTAVLWDFATRERLRVIRVGQAIARQVAFHPNGQVLATCGDIPTLSLWDIEGGSRGKFNWEIGKVQALAFAPDGMTAAAGGSGGKLAVWDLDL